MTLGFATGILALLAVLSLKVVPSLPAQGLQLATLQLLGIAALFTTGGLVVRLRLFSWPAIVSVGAFSTLFAVTSILASPLVFSKAVASFWMLPDGVRLFGIFLAGLFFGVGFALRSRHLHSPSVPALVAGLSGPALVLLAFFGHLQKLLALGLALLAAWALGAFLLEKVLHCPPDKEVFGVLKSAPIALASGLLVWQLMGVFLGTLSWLSPFSVGLTIIASLCAGFAAIKKLPSSLARALQAQATTPQIVVAAPTLAFLWAGVLPALAPEVGSDALGGRVALPVRFLAQHSLRPFDDILWSYGQVGGEVIFSFFLPWLGKQVAKLLSVGLAFIMFLAVSREKLNALFASFFLSTLVVFQFCAGHLEILQLLFWFAACQAALLAWQGHMPWIAVGALLGGGAAIKLNTLGLGILLFLALLFRRPFRASFNALVSLGLGTLAFLGPFLARSLWFSGNPLFPWLNGVFKSALVNQVPVAHFGVGLSFPKVLAVPWLIIFQPEKFVEVGSWHVLTVGSVVLLPFAWRKSSLETAWYAFMAAGSWVLWLVTEQNLRYSFAPAFFTVVAASLVLAERGPQDASAIKRFTGGLLVVAMTWGVATELVRPQFWLGRGNSSSLLPTNFISGKEDAATYLRTRLPSFSAAEFLRSRSLLQDRSCQIGFLDHLHFPGIQPTDWHSIAPWSSLIAKARFAPNLAEVVDALDRLDCPILGLALGSAAPMPWDQRQGIFSKEFIDGTWRVIFGHNGLLVLINPKIFENSPSLEAVKSVQEWRNERGMVILPSVGEVTLPQGARSYSVVAARPEWLFRIDLTSGAGGSGHVDFAFRDERQTLVGFNRHAFRFTSGRQTWTAWQSAPPGARELTVSLVGQGVRIKLPQLTAYEVRIERPDAPSAQ